MIVDAQGHAVSGATAESVALYDQAVRAYNLGYGDALGLFDAARQASPGFVMAHLGKAWLFAVANDPALPGARCAAAVSAAEVCHERARASAPRGAQRGAGVANGVPRCPCWTPPDALSVRRPGARGRGPARTASSGGFRWMRDRTARALPLWSKDMPGYGTMLAFHGFGMEETGDYARAEDESRVAAELEPHSFWPHHTVAHVMEMTGRPEDGLGWMTAREALWASARAA